MADLDGAGLPIPFAGGMIAAIALEASAPLITKNLRHFGRVSELVVRHPEPSEG